MSTRDFSHIYPADAVFTLDPPIIDPVILSIQADMPGEVPPLKYIDDEAPFVKARRRAAYMTARTLAAYHRGERHPRRGRKRGGSNWTPEQWKAERQAAEDHYRGGKFNRRPTVTEVCRMLGLHPATERKYRTDWGIPGAWKLPE